MPICTFFGHRSIPATVEPALRSALTDLITVRGVDRFYVGHHGDFDAMVRRVLRELSAVFPISYSVVLAYLPTEGNDPAAGDFSDTIVPEGIETVPRRYAILYRNRWMLRRSDFVVTCVARRAGSGAARFALMAERQGKTVLSLL